MEDAIVDERYPRISDYGIVGDGRTAALVAKDGSIDWLCWPRFDSPAVFCKLLDAQKGGSFRLGPAGQSTQERAYVEGTNILVTTFKTGRGTCRLTDFMPAPQEGSNASEPHRLYRRVDVTEGQMELELDFRPAFQFAKVEAELRRDSGGVDVRAGQERLHLTVPFPHRVEANSALARFSAGAGEQYWVKLSYEPANGESQENDLAAEATTELERTVKFWRDWIAACDYQGPYQSLVRRSALLLKLLIYHPTGALVAAPTTSLPEEIGGQRNWDYRYTWLRDAALMLDALQRLGYHAESMKFFDWIQSVCLSHRAELRLAYAVDGGRVRDEMKLDHLEGYRGSRPVRVGNAAISQIQLDVYGHLLDAAYVCLQRLPRSLDPDFWQVLRRSADSAAADWEKPDHGLWERRAEPRHHVNSKLYCWVALDRAVRLAEQQELDGDLSQWRRQRDRVREAILTRGYNGQLQAFTQTLDGDALDAGLLAIPLVDFLPATDPRMCSTIDRVRERLAPDGLMRRYSGGDGLNGGEGAFTLCNFWLIQNLAMAGKAEEAKTLFEKTCSYANDLGLLSEEIDPITGELLGNFPQGFAHLGLIRAASRLASV